MATIYDISLRKSASQAVVQVQVHAWQIEDREENKLSSFFISRRPAAANRYQTLQADRANLSHICTSQTFQIQPVVSENLGVIWPIAVFAYKSLIYVYLCTKTHQILKYFYRREIYTNRINSIKIWQDSCPCGATKFVHFAIFRVVWAGNPQIWTHQSDILRD